MDPRLLIQDIVRQTTVLIAQISTATGLRAPLAHVANQVFLDLARELEAQGVRRNVVADMFGLALRSYQLKFQRALDSASAQRSLWGDVFDALGEGAMSRQVLEDKFPRVEAKALSAVLNDLVDSGLAYRSGRGQGALYGLVPREDAERLARQDDEFATAHYLWRRGTGLGVHNTLGIGKAYVLDDPTTALNCIDRLAEILSLLARRHPPHPIRTQQGIIHFQALYTDFGRAVELAFRQIHHFGADHPVIKEKLVATVALLLAAVPEPRKPPLLELAAKLQADP